MDGSSRFCTHCGNKITEQANFCTTCGSPLTQPNSETAGIGGSQSAKVPAPPPIAPVQTAAQQYNNNYYQSQQTAHQANYPSFQGQSAPMPPQIANNPQQSYPGGYSNPTGNNSSLAGPANRQAGGGFGKFVIGLLLSFLLAVSALGAAWYVSSNGAVRLPGGLSLPAGINLPWTSALSPQDFAGQWLAVSYTENGTVNDVTKNKEKVYIEMSVQQDGSLKGVMTNTEVKKQSIVFNFKPVKNAKKMEGTVTNARDIKFATKAVLEYAADGKDILITAVDPVKGAPGSIQFRKVK